MKSLRARVADAIYRADGDAEARADAALDAVELWLHENGYRHFEGVLGIGRNLPQDSVTTITHGQDDSL